MGLTVVVVVVVVVVGFGVNTRVLGCLLALRFPPRQPSPTAGSSHRATTTTLKQRANMATVDKLRRV